MSLQLIWGSPKALRVPTRLDFDAKCYFCDKSDKLANRASSVNRVFSVILIKSMMAELLDILEKIIPSLTPENLMDESPLIKPVT